MEDDVVIRSTLNEALYIAEEQIEKLKYLRLAGTILKHRPYKKICSFGTFDLNNHIRGPSGALCYVLSPCAAKALIKHRQVWFIAVDDYMDHYWWHGVDCYSLMPFPIDFGDNLSDIPRLAKQPWPLWKKLRKEFYNLIEKSKMILYRKKNL